MPVSTVLESALLFANNIVRTYVDQLFCINGLHLQPDPAFADPDDFTWNPPYSAANDKRAFLGIEPDHSIARLHACARNPEHGKTSPSSPA